MKTKKPNDTATLENLFSELNRIKSEHDQRKTAIESEIQLILNKKFDANKTLQKAINKLNKDPEGYMYNEEHDIDAWVRFSTKDLEKNDVPYFQAYLDDTAEKHGCSYYFDGKNDLLLSGQGFDNYVIQSGYCRGDHGVWQGHKLVIEASEYTEDRQVNVSKRNQLIEAHMEKTGCFPGVFEMSTDYNDLKFVNTQPRKKSKKGSK
jgi:hypothetical protein